MKAYDSIIKNGPVRTLLLALVVALLSVLAVRGVPMLRIAENLLYDVRISYASSSFQTSAEIVIVGITEETLSSFPYRTPIDRQFLSDLVLNLDSKAVHSIALDLLFDQPTEPDKDRKLQATFNRLSVPLIFATAGFKDGLLIRQQHFLDQFTEGFTKGSAGVYRDADDGVIRAAPIWLSGQKPDQLGFAAAIADSIGVGLPDSQRLAIDYKKPANPDSPLYVIYPAHTVSLLPAAWFKGKNILIGVMLGFEDKLETPLSRLAPDSGQVPGIEIHAQLLAQLLDNRMIRQSGLLAEIGISVLIALLGLFCFAGDRKTGLALSLTFGVLFLIWVSSIFLFHSVSFMINVLSPTISLGLISTFSVIQQWRKEKAKKQFIHSAFSRCMSREYVDQLVANPDQLKVSGEKREITFLFSDLAGFTGLTERLDPEDMVNLINQYLDGACEIVIRHGGMVATIVGDALHVMFNAPVFQSDHAQRAVNAAIELDSFCRQFEYVQQSKGFDIEMTRIGLNTGVSTIGNYGGKDRIEYTAMGEAINIAARLESVNRHIGTRICISQSTMEKCIGITFRPIGCLILKGMSRRINAFEPIRLDDQGLVGYDKYIEAYRKLENKDELALTTFKDLHRDFSSDPLISFHLHRLETGDLGTTIVMRNK
jgi:adenylate cyclase